MAVSKRKKVTKSKATTEKRNASAYVRNIRVALNCISSHYDFEYGMIGRILQTIAMFLLVIYILLFHLCLYLLHC